MPAKGAQRDQYITMWVPLALQDQMKLGVIEIANLGDFTQAQAGTCVSLIDRCQEFST